MVLGLIYAYDSELSVRHPINKLSKWNKYKYKYKHKYKYKYIYNYK